MLHEIGELFIVDHNVVWRMVLFEEPLALLGALYKQECVY